jgi:hypothetical protein
MKLNILLGTALAASLAGCTHYAVADSGQPVPRVAEAALDAWPASLQGHKLEVYTENGWANAVNLAPDGKLSIVPELGTKVVEGTWQAKGDALCTSYAPRGEECWPYEPVVAAAGEYVKVRSDKGQTLTVRLLGPDETRLLERRG